MMHNHIFAIIVSIGALLSACSTNADSSNESPEDDNDTLGEEQQSNEPNQCFEITEGHWSLYSVNGNSSQCDKWSPVECDVSQDDCQVTIVCDDLDQTFSLSIDENGTTESADVYLGSGIVASCYAEFGSQTGTTEGDLYWINVVCSAQGIVCEYGSTEIYSEESSTW